MCVIMCGVKHQCKLQSLVHSTPHNTQSPFTPDPQSTICAPAFLSFILLFYFHSSQYLLGTPETSLRGLSTLNALRALTSKPAAFPPIGVAPSPFVACSKIALNNL